MHSLELGGLEFLPGHTVAEHLEASSLAPSLQTASADEDDPNDEADVAVNRNEIRSDLWHDVSWPEMTFKELHDPKHRHRRHHGK